MASGRSCRSLRIRLWAHSKFSHRNQWYLLLCFRATWARKGFLGTSSLKSEPQKVGGSDGALAQRLGRRGAGKDGIGGRCAGSRRPSSPAGPWLAGPAVTAATHDIRHGRTGPCQGGSQPVFPRQRSRPPSQRSDAGLLRVPGRRFPGGPCARVAVTAVPGQATSRPQGTCAWGGSALPLPGPDPGTQRSQGHSSLRSGDTKVRL